MPDPDDHSAAKLAMESVAKHLHGRPTAPALLLVIGAALLGGVVQPIVQGVYLSSRVVVTVILAALCFTAAFRWRKLTPNPGALRSSFEKIASDARSWLCIVAVVWLWTVTSSALMEIRRNNEIVALRNDVQSMAKVIDRIVLPRHLKKGQQHTISNFLLQFEPHEFAFKLSNRNEEAGEYRVDIEQAMLKGGWTRSNKNPYEYTEDVPEGLSLNFTQTQEHSQKPDDPRNPRPDRILQMALGLAGVRLNQTGGGSGSNVTEDRLVIGIGKRRMDSYELTVPDVF